PGLVRRGGGFSPRRLPRAWRSTIPPRFVLKLRTLNELPSYQPYVRFFFGARVLRPSVCAEMRISSCPCCDRDCRLGECGMGGLPFDAILGEITDQFEVPRPSGPCFCPVESKGMWRLS